MVYITRQVIYPYTPARKHGYTNTYKRIPMVRTESRDRADMCGRAPVEGFTPLLYKPPYCISPIGLSNKNLNIFHYFLIFKAI